MVKLSEGRPCDITGIEGYDMLEDSGGIQWPWTAKDQADTPQKTFEQQAEALAAGDRPTPDKDTQQRRLFVDGKFFHPEGKAKFLFDPPAALPEPTTKKYNLTLLTGRGSSSQWHTQTRTSKSDILRKLYPQEIYAEISPVTAQDLGIQANEWVLVSSKRATIKVRAVLSHNVKPDQVFIPMHYEVTNRLTFPSFDPHSRQPSYKACAVKVSRMRREDQGFRPGL